MFADAGAVEAAATDAGGGCGCGAAVADFDPAQPRDPQGRWTAGGGAPSIVSAASNVHRNPITKQPPASALGALLNLLNPIGPAAAQEIDPEEENRGLLEEIIDPTAELRAERYANARARLRAIDPNSPELNVLKSPGYPLPEADVQGMEAAAEAASIKRICDFAFPNGIPIGRPGTRPDIRELPGGLSEAQKAFDYLSAGGTLVPFNKGSMVRLPGNAGVVTLRPTTSSPNSPAVDINVPSVLRMKLHY